MACTIDHLSADQHVKVLRDFTDLAGITVRAGEHAILRGLGLDSLRMEIWIELERNGACDKLRNSAAPAANSQQSLRLEAINALDVPFRIEHGTQPGEFFATWRYADAQWVDAARAHGMRRAFRVRLTLDETAHIVRSTDYATEFDWSAGADGARAEWRAITGVVFFQIDKARVFGLQVDEQGRLKPELSYSYRFNLNELKAPLMNAVTQAGWTWRPTVWQGPSWLRWLTE